MYPNRGYQMGEPAEQYAVRLFGALDTQKKKVLQAKCRLLEDNIKELDEAVHDIKQENCRLTEKCSLLELQVLSLQQKLKIEEQNIDILETQIIGNKKTIKNCNKIINTREKEIRRYKADLERLKQKNTSDGIRNKLLEISQRFTNVNEVISRKTRALVEEINMQHREEKEERLQNMRSDYERCNRSLQSRIIFPAGSHFTELLEEYKTVCEKNDFAAKYILKAAHKHAKTVDEMRQRWETFVKHHADDLEKLKQFEKNNVLLDATSLKRNFQKETQLYNDVLTVGDEEIARKKDMLNGFHSNDNNCQISQKGWKFEGNWSDDKAEDIPVYVPSCQSDNNPNSRKKKRKNRNRKQRKFHNNNEPDRRQ